MKKSIYWIELKIYLALTVLSGVLCGVFESSVQYFTLGLTAPLVIYLVYLVSIKILVSSFGNNSRLMAVVAVTVMTGGAWLVFFIPGEIIRRISLKYYQNATPVETIFGPVPRL